MHETIPINNLQTGFPPPPLRGSFIEPNQARVLDRKWSEAVRELQSFRTLEDDWDGEGSVAPQAAVVETALRLAAQLESDGWEKPHRTVAGVNGTVIFEWITPTEYREVEVESAEEIESRIVREGATEAEITQLSLHD